MLEVLGVLLLWKPRASVGLPPQWLCHGSALLTAAQRAWPCPWSTTWASTCCCSAWASCASSRCALPHDHTPPSPPASNLPSSDRRNGSRCPTAINECLSCTVFSVQNVMPREVFDRFDTNGDGYLDQVEQWRMLKVRCCRAGREPVCVAAACSGTASKQRTAASVC